MAASSATIPDLIAVMVGRPLQALFGEDVPRQIGETILEARGLSRGRRVREAYFTLKAGEILGFGGLVGGGRTELMRLIFGADRAEAGEVLMKGASASPWTRSRRGSGWRPKAARAMG